MSLDGRISKGRRIKRASLLASFQRPYAHVVHADVDPAVGFTAVYMQFFNYFLVEKLFGGNRHFGISDERVIKQLTDIYCRGLLCNKN